jgi:DNA repair exonuclease SbcCD ATPase subunit
MIRVATVFGLAIVISIATFSVGRAQAPPSSGQAELLQEVKRLRESIEELTSTNARVQIVFGRLQLQEQRATVTARRLEELRTPLARVTNEAVELARQAVELDDRLRTFGGDAERRKELELEARQVRALAAQQETERQRLQNEAAQAAAILAGDQARWTELNQQLDELERVLARPRR